ncbi:MAG: DNA cytosine methyltransferase [Phototrophicaceae bacterium]
MKIASLFAGAGGLDLGFEQAVFKLTWANEHDSKIWATFKHNFPDVTLDQRDIRDVPSNDIPNDIVGVVGGPPCQSWSEAGAQRGIDDDRGKLFYQYIRVLRDKQPLFFLAENVQGMLFKRNEQALHNILEQFDRAGYTVQYTLLNTVDYGVPQDRKRVIFVGYHKDLNLEFEFPAPHLEKMTLRDAIGDLTESAQPAMQKNHSNGDMLSIPNHEYMIGGHSSMFMSRNRVRTWDEPSFTIQAGGRHAPIHPQASVMIKVDKDVFEFDPSSPKPYRRLSVREAARIQTFPDDFIFQYQRVADGYKMVGNAVPVTFAYHLATQIYADLEAIALTHDNQKPILNEAI